MEPCSVEPVCLGQKLPVNDRAPLLYIHAAPPELYSCFITIYLPRRELQNFSWSGIILLCNVPCIVQKFNEIISYREGGAIGIEKNQVTNNQILVLVIKLGDNHRGLIMEFNLKNFDVENIKSKPVKYLVMFSILIFSIVFSYIMISIAVKFSTGKYVNVFGWEPNAPKDKPDTIYLQPPVITANETNPTMEKPKSAKPGRTKKLVQSSNTTEGDRTIAKADSTPQSPNNYKRR